MVTEVGPGACTATDSVSVVSPKKSAVSQRVARSISSLTSRHQHGSGANLQLGHRRHEEETLRRRCRHRSVQYLNNITEQDHRAIKRRVKAKAMIS
jgi:transposase-like protein